MGCIGGQEAGAQGERRRMFSDDAGERNRDQNVQGVTIHESDFGYFCLFGNKISTVNQLW